MSRTHGETVLFVGNRDRVATIQAETGAALQHFQVGSNGNSKAGVCCYGAFRQRRLRCEHILLSNPLAVFRQGGVTPPRSRKPCLSPEMAKNEGVPDFASQGT